MNHWDFDGCWGALFSDKPTSTSRGNSLDEGVQMTIFTDLSCSVSNPSADFTPFQKKGVTGVPTNMVLSDKWGIHPPVYDHVFYRENDIFIYFFTRLFRGFPQILIHHHGYIYIWVYMGIYAMNITNTVL